MFKPKAAFFCKSIITVVFLFSVYCGTCNVIIAQENKMDSSANSIDNVRPEMNGHQFVTTTLVDGPFMNTYFSLSAGLGTSNNYDFPLVIRGEEVQGLFGQITYVALDIRYQQNIKDWLAFNATVKMKGRLGSQTISVMTEGINIGNSFNFGWVIKAIESRKLMLSAGINLATTSVTVFNLSDFIEKAIENGEITPDNKLIKTTNVTAGTIGLKGAYAFNRTFGCIGNFNFGYGESASSSSNRGYFDAGISFDADLKAKYSFPFGFALGYNWNNYSQSDVNFSNPQNILFKINYTGRKDFDLGAEMNAQFYSMERFGETIDMNVLFVKASIAYYF